MAICIFEGVHWLLDRISGVENWVAYQAPSAPEARRHFQPDTPVHLALSLAGMGYWVFRRAIGDVTSNTDQRIKSYHFVTFAFRAPMFLFFCS